jgi:hypothetical protein
MKKIIFILITTFFMVGCRSYNAFDHLPNANLQKKLPTIDIEFDSESFATLTGFSTNTISGTTYSLSGISTLGVFAGQSKSYTSKSLNDIKSIYNQNMYKNIVSKYGTKKGKVVCRLVTGNEKLSDWGMTVLSGVTLFIPNLLGLPIASCTTEMVVELNFYNLKNELIASYQSDNYRVKKWYALYWGHSDPSGISKTEAFKLCIADLNKQIENHYYILNELLDE